MTTLPTNAFGYTVFAIVLTLVFVTPFTLTIWLMSLVSAPWWATYPLAMLVSIRVSLKLVKFKNR